MGDVKERVVAVADAVDGVLAQVAVMGAVDEDGTDLLQPVQVLVDLLGFPAGVCKDGEFGPGLDFAGASQQEQDGGLDAGA